MLLQCTEVLQKLIPQPTSLGKLVGLFVLCLFQDEWTWRLAFLQRYVYVHLGESYIWPTGWRGTTGMTDGPSQIVDFVDPVGRLATNPRACLLRGLINYCGRGLSSVTKKTCQPPSHVSLAKGPFLWAFVFSSRGQHSSCIQPLCMITATATPRLIQNNTQNQRQSQLKESWI